MSTVAAAVCGGDQLHQAAATLGLTEQGPPVVVLLDAADERSIARAALLPVDLPRVVVADDRLAGLLRAAGVRHIASQAEPQILGPLVRAALPPVPERRTRLVVVTSLRGGVGRTMLVANLARHLAREREVWAVDLTGSGALAWWLTADAQPWQELEPLVDELTLEHLRVVAADPTPRLHIIGGRGDAPSPALADAALDALLAPGELVIVDAPALPDPRARSARSDTRVLLLSYGDAASLAMLGATSLDGVWLIASQCDRLDGVTPFRALPRDEGAVGTALRRRGEMGGGLGRAYRELATLISLDAS